MHSNYLMPAIQKKNWLEKQVASTRKELVNVIPTCVTDMSEKEYRDIIELGDCPYTDLKDKNEVKLDGWFTIEQLCAVIARHNTLHKTKE